MRGLHDVMADRPVTPSEVRTGWLAGLEADSVVYRAPLRWALLFGAGAGIILACAGFLVLVAVDARPAGPKPDTEWVALSLGIGMGLLGALVLRLAIHTLLRRPTVAIDRSGVRIWPTGLIPWEGIESLTMVRSGARSGNVLSIKRVPGTGPRGRFRLSGYAAIQQRLVGVELRDVLRVMEQYATAAENTPGR
jgi:hypothetical protein